MVSITFPKKSYARPHIRPQQFDRYLQSGSIFMQQINESVDTELFILRKQRGYISYIQKSSSKNH